MGGQFIINNLALPRELNVRTCAFLDIVPGGGGGRPPTGDVRHLEHGHRAVEQAVYDLESSRLVAPYRRSVPHVARLALTRGVFKHHIGRLEDAQRQRMRPVLAYRLEQALQERRTHYLELERLWVRYLDCRLVVVGRVKPGEVFFVGALDGHTSS